MVSLYAHQKTERKRGNEREKQRKNIRREMTDKRRKSFRKGGKKKHETWSSEEDILKQENEAE